MAWFFVDEHGTRNGPIEEKELLDLRAMGVISPSTLVWTQGFEEWVPLGRAFPAPPEPERTAPQGPSAIRTIGKVALLLVGLVALFIVVGAATFASRVAGGVLLLACLVWFGATFARRRVLRSRFTLFASSFAAGTATLTFLAIALSVYLNGILQADREAALRAGASSGDLAAAADAFEELERHPGTPVDLLREFRPLLADELSRRAAARAAEASKAVPSDAAARSSRGDDVHPDSAVKTDPFKAYRDQVEQIEAKLQNQFERYGSGEGVDFTTTVSCREGDVIPAGCFAILNYTQTNGFTRKGQLRGATSTLGYILQRVASESEFSGISTVKYVVLMAEQDVYGEYRGEMELWVVVQRPFFERVAWSNLMGDPIRVVRALRAGADEFRLGPLFERVVEGD